MTTAVYAGSFDPITLGHMDVITRASRMFEELVVAIGVNSSKKPLLTFQERHDLIAGELHQHRLDNVRIASFEGLLVDFCATQHASVIVRGLRAVMDFEAEMTMSEANRSINPRIDTVFIPTKPEYSFVSSSTVKEIARVSAQTGSDSGWYSLQQYVPLQVKVVLRNKFEQQALPLGVERS